MNYNTISLDNGLKVRYCSWGDDHDPAILFLHGLGSTGASFDELASMLSTQFRILAFDLPGHGGSTGFQEEKFYTPEALAEWVLNTLNILKVNEIHIAGHSIGGNIALAAAKNEEVKSLILLDGGYLRSSSLPESNIEDEVMVAERHCLNYTFASWELYEAELKENGMRQPLIELAKHSMKREADQIQLILSGAAAKFYMKAHFFEPSEKTMMGVSAPVLLLRSTEPAAFNKHREVAADRLKGFVDVTVEPIKDSSHDLYWEHPVRISKSIRQWINKYQ